MCTDITLSHPSMNEPEKLCSFGTLTDVKHVHLHATFASLQSVCNDGKDSVLIALHSYTIV